MKIKIQKNCTTCPHENHPYLCRYCIEFSNHEFKCCYCKGWKATTGKFCDQEDEDGSMNCFHGDGFRFNDDKYEIEGKVILLSAYEEKKSKETHKAFIDNILNNSKSF